MAWSYDVVSWLVSLGQWRQWQEAALPYVNGADVLELAHGPGHLLLRLKEAGYRVVGIDSSPYMGALAHKRLRRVGASVPLVRARAQTLPLAPSVFDVVVSTFPAEFIVENDTVECIFRSLRPGGRLVIVPEARFIGGGPVRGFIEWLYAITGQRQGPLDGHEPSRLWMMTRQRFTDAGFELRDEQVELSGSVVTVVVAEKPCGG